MLREAIGDGPPRCARRDKDMEHRANARIVVQQSGRNADGRKIGRFAGSVAAADAATFTRAPPGGLILCKRVLASGETELVGIDMRIGRESRTAEFSTYRAMAGRERPDLVDLETNRTAGAASMNHRVLSITAVKNPSVPLRCGDTLKYVAIPGGEAVPTDSRHTSAQERIVKPA